MKKIIKNKSIMVMLILMLVMLGGCGSKDTDTNVDVNVQTNTDDIEVKVDTDINIDTDVKVQADTDVVVVKNDDNEDAVSDENISEDANEDLSDVTDDDVIVETEEVTAKGDVDDNTEDNIASSEVQNEAEYVEYRFKNKYRLDEHYEKHGIEMGFDSAKSYEKAASDVINNPSALTKLEAEDGDYVYYVEESNEFVILSPDGFIRTYFNPSAGKAYFDRQ